ncbi:MAG TPA: Ig-like domain-containing protein, partial [Longimicrobium sp.]
IIGETLQLSASIRDRDGAELTGRAVEWSSDNPGVARVDANGAITAVSAGSAKITARSDGQVGSTTIRVVDVAVKRVTLNVLDFPSVVPGQTIQLVATAFDAAEKPLTGRPIRWATEDTTEATITPTGLVTIVRAGQVAVSATIGGAVAVLHINIYPRGDVWPDTVTLLPGGNRRLEARAFDARGRAEPLRFAIWESSDPSVARVDSAGQITAVATGRATITAVLGRDRVQSQLFVISYPRPLRFTEVASGQEHSCGLTPEGDAYCWGASSRNQLGTQQITSRCEIFAGDRGSLQRSLFRCSALPVQVAGGLRFTSITAGNAHTCGLTAAGAAHCWGDGYAGAGPVPVAGGITFRSLTAGTGFTCGISTANEAYCWGDNSDGVLGNGTTTASSVPTKVAGGLLFATLESGYSHTCGITTDGVAYCWGGNGSGQLGTGTQTASSRVPARVVGDVRFTSLSAGTFRTCGLDATGRAYCLGLAPAPVPVAGNITFAILIVGDDSCGLTADGNRYCWPSLSVPPTRAVPDFPVRRYASGLNADCFISLDGVTYCAGTRYYGQTGDGLIDSSPYVLSRVAGQ